ncbi:hypothetical protein BLOT_003725 [Blomia tropicalis]|nr:hypothetical protein BLOT_003725 [Blomia tropicalis]
MQEDQLVSTDGRADEQSDATPYLEKLELWIEQLPAEAEETIQKYNERLSIWSAKAAVLETQRKMTLDRLHIEEAAKHGRTQRIDLPKIELAKHAIQYILATNQSASRGSHRCR